MNRKNFSLTNAYHFLSLHQHLHGRSKCLKKIKGIILLIINFLLFNSLKLKCHRNLIQTDKKTDLKDLTFLYKILMVVFSTHIRICLYKVIIIWLVLLLGNKSNRNSLVYNIYIFNISECMARPTLWYFVTTPFIFNHNESLPPQRNSFFGIKMKAEKSLWS